MNSYDPLKRLNEDWWLVIGWEAQRRYKRGASKRHLSNNRLTMNTIEVLKLIAIPLTFAMSIVPGVLPIYCKGCKQNPKCMSIVMTFSGGIFLAMGLVHIYPDVSDSDSRLLVALMRSTVKQPATSLFPTQSSFLGRPAYDISYFLIFAFEKLICPNTHEIAHHHEHDDGEHGAGHSRVGDSMVKIKEAEEGNGVHEEHPSSSKVTISHNNSSSHGVNTAKFCQSLVIMVALGIHSFFEGLALGVNGIEEDVIALFFGIGLHKWAEGLSIVRWIYLRPLI